MARFRFPLQPVLDHRLRAERERQRDVAQLEAERLRLESQLHQFAHDVQQEKLAQRDRLSASDLAGARMQAASIARLDSRANRIVVELAGIHRRIESARAALLEAMKARKAVELLRERRHDEWRHEQNRLEAAATDEIAVMQSARSNEGIAEGSTHP